jgi:hypothetical protein
MFRIFRCASLAVAVPILLLTWAHAQSNGSTAANSETQLTIYNTNFAVARTRIPLKLHVGANDVLTTNVTSQLEPDSVVLRDSQGRNAFRVAEQNYDAAVVNQQWLLEKYEGKTLQFVRRPSYTAVLESGQIKTVPDEIVTAKILRAGNSPLVEVDGHLQFVLPGAPLFPALSDGLLLKPTLHWLIESTSNSEFDAELDYITRGFSWQATYNIVVPEEQTMGQPERASLEGWVTINNQSGTDFPSTRLQLMAGDVAKLPPVMRGGVAGSGMYDALSQNVAVVAEKAFDDFHLYTLPRPVNLKNGETKQVQFMEGDGVTVTRSYEYRPFPTVAPYFSPGFHNAARVLGGEPSRHVEIRQEIQNSKTNHLGLPMPAGRMRVYRRESTGQMQFVGESTVEHTPENQTLRISSGQAFDLTAERIQTDFHVDQNSHIMDESFQIKFSNAKPEPVTIHAIESLNRSENWQVTEHSADFTKHDAHTLDFPTKVPAKGESTFTYTVHYTW